MHRNNNVRQRARLMAAILVMGLSTATALAQGIYTLTSEAADRAAHAMEERLRESGLRITPEDRKRIEYFTRHQQAVMELRKKSVEAERVLRTAGKDKEADALIAERKKLDAIWKELPTPPSDAQLAKNFPGFTQQMNAYTKQRAKGNEKAIETIGTKVLKADKQAQQIREGKGGGDSSAGGKNAYEVEVTLSPGPDEVVAKKGIEVYINGVKIERNKQTVPITLGGPLILRVVGIDNRRSMVRDFKGSANSWMEDGGTDYKFSYTVNNGGYKATSALSIKSEEYQWAYQFTNADPKEKISTSKLVNAVKDDLFSIEYTHPFNATIEVTCATVWTNNATRPGGNRVSDEKGSAKGIIKLLVVPRG